MHVILEESIEISNICVAEFPRDFSYFRDWVAGEQRQRIVEPHNRKTLLQAHAVSRLELSTQRLLRDSHFSRDDTDGHPRIRVLTVDDVIDKSSWIVKGSTSRISRRIASTLANLCNHFLLDMVWMIRLLSGHKRSPVTQSAAVKQSWNPGMNCQIRNLLRTVSASYSNEIAAAEALPGAFFTLCDSATPPETAQQEPWLFTIPSAPKGGRSCDAAICLLWSAHREAWLGASRLRRHRALNDVLCRRSRRSVRSSHEARLSSSQRKTIDEVREAAQQQSILMHIESGCGSLMFPISNGELSACCACETGSPVTDSSPVHKSNIRRSGNRDRFTRAMTEVINGAEFIR